MKLIKQKTLYFSEGKSDKVYEVDLYESGQDLFIVNFRYGRRGANLREGTKTVFPVAFEEAEKIFNKLVESKEKKGYSENGKNNVKTTVKKTKPKVNTAREETILTYLKEANLGTYTRNWKLSRIIMRTIALNMTNAIDYIKPFLNSKDEFEQYATIYVLAHFKNTTEIETIFTIFKENKFTNKVGRIAVSYLLKFGNSMHYNAVKEQVKNDKRVTLTDDVIGSIASHLLSDKNIDANIVYYTYLMAFENEKLKEKLFEFIQKTPLKVNTFKSIRYIYRTAEIINDIPFLTLLAKRIAISNPGYSSSSWDVYVDGNWVNPTKEKTKRNPKIAFSSKTKAYFDKTAYKLIVNYSKTATDDYIEYATNLLCSLDDKIDNQKEDVQYIWDYDYEADQYKNEKHYFPKYSNFLALMYIVYGNSNKIKGTIKRYFTEELKDATKQRSEILPTIWDTKPQEILTILANAKSDIAIEFSLKIIQDNPKFLENITNALLTKLVGHYDERVLEIILPILKEKYKNTQPEESILFALLESTNQRANNIAVEWLTTYEENYFTQKGFISKLLLTKQLFIIDYLTKLYTVKVTYNMPFSITEINSFFEKESNYNFDYLLLVNQLIGSTNFGELLAETSEKEIKNLAISNNITNKLFAINLAKHNKIPAFQLFKDNFDSYINSDEKIIRKAGIEILAHFPDAFLLEHKHKIGSYCFSEHVEVRGAIQPSIERLIKLDANFKEKLLNQLLNTIIQVEDYTGVHENSYAVLVKYYDKNLPSINTKGIVNLVLSDYDFAQKLGTPLFNERVVLKDFTIDELVALSTSAVIEIRESLHQFFKDNIARINYELEDALKVFNSKWQDVINWSCTFFEAHIKLENWTLELLLYVSDHTKKDVQAFGRKMITIHFSKDKGLPLLLKLQEHPTKEMQFFVTNYLDNYASNNTEVILKLAPFFKTSLFNINTNRATKTRIYTFLKREIKNEKVAEMTIKIIKTVLGTKTIKDNSHHIDLLLEIHEAHPNLEVPLTIKTV